MVFRLGILFHVLAGEAWVSSRVADSVFDPQGTVRLGPPDHS